MSGLRYNQNKLPHHLISPFAMDELARVLQKGAEKYALRNWEQGLKWDECVGSLMRHVNAWRRGEEVDPETGLSHMAHVLCNAMFLSHFEVTKTGTDDRPQYSVLPTQEQVPAKYNKEKNEQLGDSLQRSDGIAGFARQHWDQRDNPNGWNTLVDSGLFGVQADLFPETER